MWQGVSNAVWCRDVNLDLRVGLLNRMRIALQSDKSGQAGFKTGAQELET